MHAEYSAPYHYYLSPGARTVARKLKTQEEAAVKKAAVELAQYIPDGCVLIPMPSHTGFPVAMKALCREIAKITHSTVVYAIQGAPRETMYAVKKRGETMTEKTLNFKQVKLVPQDKDIIIIDNVVDSGRTALAACHAMTKGIVLAYAHTTNPKLPGLFFYKPEQLRARIEAKQFFRNYRYTTKNP